MLDDDGRVDAAAHVESGGQSGEARAHTPDEVVENRIGDRLMEDAKIPIRPDIKLQRFQFDAEGFWDVFEVQYREIGLARLRTETGELRYPDADCVVA